MDVSGSNWVLPSGRTQASPFLRWLTSLLFLSTHAKHFWHEPPSNSAVSVEPTEQAGRQLWTPTRAGNEPADRHQGCDHTTEKLEEVLRVAQQMLSLSLSLTLSYSLSLSYSLTLLLSLSLLLLLLLNHSLTLSILLDAE